MAASAIRRFNGSLPEALGSPGNTSRIQAKHPRVGFAMSGFRIKQEQAVGDAAAPRTQEFKQQFDWPDALIHVRFDSLEIARQF
jgi:hypothetical protein